MQARFLTGPRHGRLIDPLSSRAGRLIDPLSNRTGWLIDPLSDSARPRPVLNRADRFIFRLTGEQTGQRLTIGL